MAYIELVEVVEEDAEEVEVSEEEFEALLDQTYFEYCDGVWCIASWH